jgi:hypothetical protein
MKTEFKRRDFVTTCFKAGVGCCAFAYGAKLSGQSTGFNQDEKPDPKKLEYCGFKCPVGCPLKKGTSENNVELKKKGYETFNLKEKFGIEFDPDKVFCYGCKAKDKPVSLITGSCTVRSCVTEKGYECCIECDGLATCDKELWTKFPDFKKAVIDMQKKYKTS